LIISGINRKLSLTDNYYSALYPVSKEDEVPGFVAPANISIFASLRFRGRWILQFVDP
jgi:hypothetical protein